MQSIWSFSEEDSKPTSNFEYTFELLLKEKHLNRQDLARNEQNTVCRAVKYFRNYLEEHDIHTIESDSLWLFQ